MSLVRSRVELCLETGIILPRSLLHDVGTEVLLTSTSRNPVSLIFEGFHLCCLTVVSSVAVKPQKCCCVSLFED